MKRIKVCVLTVFLLNIFSISWGNANSPHDYLIYVSGSYDKHPTHITVYTIGYWVSQASLLKKSSKEVFTSSASCEKNHYGRLILSLEPNIFYNPIMQILYGGISTKVYGDDGKVITTLNSEDEIYGPLTVLYEKLVDKLYKKVLTKVQDQIHNDEAINLYLKQKKAQ